MKKVKEAAIIQVEKIDEETVTFGSKYRKPTPMYEKF